MKFQDSTFNGLKVTVGTKKCDAHMHGQTDASSKSNMSAQLFQSWGLSIGKARPNLIIIPAFIHLRDPETGHLQEDMISCSRQTPLQQSSP